MNRFFFAAGLIQAMLIVVLISTPILAIWGHWELGIKIALTSLFIMILNGALCKWVENKIEKIKNSKKL